LHFRGEAAVAGEPDLDDLDALIRRVDSDRWISSRFVGDAERRADLIALYAYDYELGRAPKVASNALLGEIRLTWWREALDEIYTGVVVRQHPVAQALATAIRRRDLPREPLEAMNDARYRELDPTAMSEAEALDWACGSAGKAAELAARLLDPATDAGLAQAAGAVWAMDKRFGREPALAPALHRLLTAARSASRALSPAAFPAIAHATLAGRPEATELRARWRITLAVARGRI
jgi:phytoene synthase